MINQIAQDDFESIVYYIELGEQYISKKEYRKAFDLFYKALEKVPDEKQDWDISLDIYCELGDCSLALNEINNADYFFNKALGCPDGFISGKVWIGLGKFYNTQGLVNKTQDAFMRAYMLEGVEIFEKENNKEFFKFIKKFV